MAFPSIGNRSHEFFQCLEKTALPVSNAWKTEIAPASASPQSALTTPQGLCQSGAVKPSVIKRKFRFWWVESGLIASLGLIAAGVLVWLRHPEKWASWMGIFFVGAVLYILLLIIFWSRLTLVERRLDASEIHKPRIYRRVYKNDDWWFSIFKAEDSDEHILLATVPGAGCWDIAMKLSPQEVALFRERLNDFVSLAKDFVDRRELPEFKQRRLEKFHWHGDTLEAEV